MICKNCGAAAPDKDAFCVNCGAALRGGEGAREETGERQADAAQAGEEGPGAAPEETQQPEKGAAGTADAAQAGEEGPGAAPETMQQPEKGAAGTADAAQAGEEGPGTAPEGGPKRKKIFRRRAQREAMPVVPPEDLVPLTTGQALGILAAFCVPVLNWVLMLRWAYGARGNESRRSLARAGLAFTGILLAAAIVALLAFIFAVRAGLVAVSGVI